MSAAFCKEQFSLGTPHHFTQTRVIADSVQQGNELLLLQYILWLLVRVGRLKLRAMTVVV